MRGLGRPPLAGRPAGKQAGPGAHTDTVVPPVVVTAAVDDAPQQGHLAVASPPASPFQDSQLQAGPSPFEDAVALRFEAVDSMNADSPLTLEDIQQVCLVFLCLLYNSAGPCNDWCRHFQQKGKARRDRAARQSSGQKLTIEMLARRNLHNIQGADVVQELGLLHHVELDREQLAALAPEPLSHLTSIKKLFLQHNRLEDVTALSTLTGLRFLTVAHNNLTHVSYVSQVNVSYWCEVLTRSLSARCLGSWA